MSTETTDAGKAQSTAHTGGPGTHGGLVAALEVTRRELAHWLAWKNGVAMHPQREKGEAAVKIADLALARARGETT